MHTVFQSFLFPLGWAVALLLAGAAAWRILRGPTTLDRLVGLDSMVVAMVTVAALFSLQTRAMDFLEFILLITAIGFFTTVLFYYYLAQPKGRAAEDFNEEQEGQE